MGGSLLDVPGLRLGHWTGKGTGCTVVLVDGPGAVGAIDVRGGAPASFNTESLYPGRLGSPVNALVLSGGSAFGLETCAGVMQYLAEAGVGLPFGGSKVPIVCGAAIFDLAIAEGPPPDKRAGYEAARAASATEDHRGRVGGGAGATVGKALGRPGVMPGGLGMASAPCGPHTVGAIAVVNAVGDIFDRDGRIVAGARREDGSFADAVTLIAESGVMRRLPPIANTTLAIVATGAPLTRDAAVRVARMAHDGMARAIRPAHTLTDGDVVFVLSVPSADAPPADVGAIGTMAAEALQDAILDAVRPNA